MERVVAERHHDFLLDAARLLCDEIAERRVAVAANRFIEARDRARSRPHLLHMLERKLRLVCDLFVRRCALEHQRELPFCACHLLLALDDVDGNADRA